MKRLVLFLGVLGVLAMSGCGDYQMAEKSKEVVISKEEYEQLKASAASAVPPKQVGRYQIHTEGLRTWRLDTATGKSCLMLMTDADYTRACMASAAILYLRSHEADFDRLCFREKKSALDAGASELTGWEAEAFIYVDGADKYASPAIPGTRKIVRH